MERIGEAIYNKKDRLGMGGQAAVYKGLYGRAQIPCAIKVIPIVRNDEKVMVNVQNELYILPQIKQDRNIVKTYAIEKTEADIYIISELIEGYNLLEYIQEIQMISEQELVSIIGQLCRAFNHLNQLNIIHRDIKPQNIMRETDGTIKLIDFGIARQLNPVFKSQFFGQTELYKFPCHFLTGDEKDYGRQADIWALGVTLYFLFHYGDQKESKINKKPHIDDYLPFSMQDLISIDEKQDLQTQIDMFLLNKQRERQFQNTNLKEAIYRMLRVKEQITWDELCQLFSQGSVTEPLTFLLTNNKTKQEIENQILHSRYNTLQSILILIQCTYNQLNQLTIVYKRKNMEGCIWNEISQQLQYLDQLQFFLSGQQQEGFTSKYKLLCFSYQDLKYLCSKSAIIKSHLTSLVQNFRSAIYSRGACLCQAEKPEELFKEWCPILCSIKPDESLVPPELLLIDFLYNYILLTSGQLENEDFNMEKYILLKDQKGPRNLLNYIHSFYNQNNLYV